MTEILFYQLQGQTLERVLPPLLLKSLERGWRVAVQAASEERVEALDAHLWTWRDGEAEAQPVLLTVNDDNPNGASVRFLLEGAAAPTGVSTYQRVVLLFDGEDADALANARQHWSAAKSAGLTATYWLADENGHWQRQG
jgi:DNA polymerase-3 subunit chi